MSRLAPAFLVPLCILWASCGDDTSVLGRGDDPAAHRDFHDASGEASSLSFADASSQRRDASAEATTANGNDADVSDRSDTDAGHEATDAPAPADGGGDSVPFDASDAARVLAACTGPFDWQGVSTPGLLPLGITVGELNGDGKPDLIVIETPKGSQTSVVKVALGNASRNFGAFVDFGVGASPATSVVTGDVNGDGKLDLIVTNGGDGTVSVLLNTTTKNATAPSFATKVDFAASKGASSVAIGDFNGDALPDLAIANPGAGTVSVLLSTTPAGGASPSFRSKVDVTVGTQPSSVAAADINGDGKPDLVVNDATGSTVSVLLDETAVGATTPAFGTKTDFAAGLGPAFVTTGDLNGDGKPDLAIASHGESSVTVLLNTTPAAAVTPTMATKRAFAVSGAASSIAIADVNGDAKLDLAVGNDTPWMSGVAAGSSISILLNTTPIAAAAPSFAGAVETPWAPSPHAVVASDLEGDGRPDLVVAAQLSSVLLFHNTTTAGASSPHFGSRWDFAAGGGLTTTDINSDGKPDLVGTGVGVQVLLNTTMPGASEPTFTSWSPVPLASAKRFSSSAGDLNGDGRPDLVLAGGTDGATVRVVLNTTPAGAFTPTLANSVDFPAGNVLSGVVLGDVNTDGKLDIVLANPGFGGGSLGAGSVSILLNTTPLGAATPSFAPKVDIAPVAKDACGGLAPYHAALGDLNGDGKPDLVIAASCDAVDVRINTTPKGGQAPSFGPEVDVVGGGLDVAVSDFNGDGVPDILTGSAAAVINTTPAGATTPTFASPLPINRAGTVYGVAIADFNGDGKPDATWADISGLGAISFNQSAGTSAMSFGEPVYFAVGVNPQRVVAADLNGDGALDLAFNPGTSVLINACLP